MAKEQGKVVMHDHFEHMAKVCERALYLLSGSITLGGMVDVLDHHSWIIGLLLGLMTFAANCYFKWKQINLMADKKQ